VTATSALVEWALGLELASVPEPVRRAACLHLLDGVGVAVAAARTDAAAFVVEAAGRWGAPEEATVIGYGRRLPAPMAALANGALVHALDYDDTHAEALVHATAAVLPATFAVGEEMGSLARDVLAASIAAYEVVIRLGAAVRHGFHERGFHATSVCGVFAAALAAARLMRLGVPQAVNALGIAGSQASGSLEFLETGSSTKQLHPGLAGMSGVIAARLAAAGADGPATILEGRYGLYSSFAGREVDPAAITDGLGSRWETARITVKPYPACQLSHASLDALAGVRPSITDLAAIEQITFDLPTETIPIVCEPAETKRRPRTPYEGKFSLPYCAAALLTDGELGIGSFEPERMARPGLVGLAARVAYREREFDGAPADAPGMVEVRLRDGRVLRCDAAHHRGGPDAPLGEEEVLGKFASNCGGSSPASQAVAAAVLDLASAPALSPILEATASLRVPQEVP
jgi:2-methylcitrate dehydratase PrpD